LAAADLLILPSYAEGLPTVLVEAGACGTPVLATRVGGIPELLQQDRGRLIEPGSAPALREAILDVLARPEVARQQAERLREHVREAFDADLNAGHLLRVYQELISGSGAT
jgi:teichuronic acid biosynthesis glycosyltransferase TuaC